MAYFSNGTEGMQYTTKYCDRCVNWHESEPGAEDWGCPIWDLHQEYNYDQCRSMGKPEYKFIHETLGWFIPTGEDTFAKQCKMFLEKPDVDVPGQMKMFEEAKA